MLMEPRTEASPRLAAEGSPAYSAAAVSPVAGQLDHVAALAARRDRDMGELVRTLVAVSRDDGLGDLTGGMSLHVWLQHTARCTHPEAREVLGAVEVLRAMPATLAGLADRWLSWSQTSAICRAARRVPVDRRSELDDLVGGAMLRHRDWEPDALVADVWQWVDGLQPTRLEQAEAAAEREQFLTLAPRLFGGGSAVRRVRPGGVRHPGRGARRPAGPTRRDA